MDGQERSGRLFAEGDGCRAYLGFAMGPEPQPHRTHVYRVLPFSIDITYDTHHTISQ
jgi:hypothetical protein